jgi:hypothetical protein
MIVKQLLLGSALLLTISAQYSADESSIRNAGQHILVKRADEDYGEIKAAKVSKRSKKSGGKDEYEDIEGNGSLKPLEEAPKNEEGKEEGDDKEADDKGKDGSDKETKKSSKKTKLGRKAKSSKKKESDDIKDEIINKEKDEESDDMDDAKKSDKKKSRKIKKDKKMKQMSAPEVKKQDSSVGPTITEAKPLDNKDGAPKGGKKPNGKLKVDYRNIGSSSLMNAQKSSATSTSFNVICSVIAVSIVTYLF